ncbi:hypothetical protein [Pseudodesulfovibrio pelocollis]|uniref:hypothetical protein n=1 Tax=Pseudodesulfovibrio pelocollis TaxID=3051432 RepID=UPI00255B3A8E|nr:hypothetical protein [Pseudodesulfovibrio sp. SB368]
MMIHGETVHSPLPQDLPWWMPDHFVFFGVLYIVLAVIGIGLTYTIVKSWCDAKKAQH